MITTMHQHILQQQREISQASRGQIRILDVRPQGIQQRTRFIVASKREMKSLLDGRAK